MAKKVEASFTFSPIGFVGSPFKDRFGVPRQPGLANEAKGIIQILPDPDFKTALRGLEEFSHIWLLFVFHDHGGNKWKPSIRPPRLGGNQKVGVLSSRSPHRPNPIGMSAVKLEKIDWDHKLGPQIHVSGIDLIDQTPILDIKPYINYADSIPEATLGWASAPIKKYKVEFSQEALEKIEALKAQHPELKNLIIQILELDPRPAFQQRQNPIGEEKSNGLKFGIDILGYDIKYEITAYGILVTLLTEMK